MSPQANKMRLPFTDSFHGIQVAIYEIVAQGGAQENCTLFIRSLHGKNFSMSMNPEILSYYSVQSLNILHVSIVLSSMGTIKELLNCGVELYNMLNRAMLF